MMDILSLPLSAPSSHHFDAAAAAAAAAAASTLDVDDDIGGGSVVNNEVHEFVIIYEGPPAPAATTSLQTIDGRCGRNNDTISSSSSSSNGSRKNRRAFCLSIPPSTTASCTSSNSINTTTFPSSYVSEQDLLAYAAKQIGWPAHILCCRQQQHQQLQQHVDNELFLHHISPTSSIYHPPTQTLHHHHSLPINITLHSQYTLILGGKGGFGTLLRGQSRQAGAKRTVDFGACRDLSGRRLRHVNDELKLRKWKEVEEARMRVVEAAASSSSGDAAAAAKASLSEAELSALRTPSGIRNWHLSIPSWSDVPTTTNKGRRKVDRQLEREVRGYQMKEERIRTEQEKKRMEKENSVLEYVRRGEKEGERVSSIANVSSVKEEILAHLRKRKLDERGGGSKIDEGTGGGESGPMKMMASESVIDSNDSGKGSDPSCRFLMTLSGEISILETTSTTPPSKSLDNHVAETRSSIIQRIQSQSDFATAVVLLDASKLRDISCYKERDRRGVYIEYTIQTAGLAQIGWIRGPGGKSSSTSVNAFLPNSDTGDGVGDDSASYGYDGSRGLKFHGGEEETSYGPSFEDSTGVGGWKPGDILGSYCRFSGLLKTGKSDDDLAKVEIGYTLNGVDLGIAFTVPVAEDDAFHFFPALSLNLDEVVDVNIGPEFAYNSIDGCVGASELVMSETTNDVAEDDNDVERGGEDGLMSNNGNEEKAPSQKRHRDGPLVEPSIDDEAVKATTTKQGDMDKPSKCTEEDTAFDLNKCNSVDELKSLGPDRLKSIMLSMGVKCGGTIDERANRLFSLKGLRREEYPNKVRGKNFVL